MHKIGTELVHRFLGDREVGRQLTDTEVDALTEMMRSHMDKAITYGAQSQSLINNIRRHTHFLSHHLFPRLGAISYPSVSEGMFEDASDNVDKLADLMDEWGDALKRLDKEYTAMIESISEFHDKLDPPVPAPGGNGSMINS